LVLAVQELVYKHQHHLELHQQHLVLPLLVEAAAVKRLLQDNRVDLVAGAEGNAQVVLTIQVLHLNLDNHNLQEQLITDLLAGLDLPDAQMEMAVEEVVVPVV
jgi:hypothetical protein